MRDSLSCSVELRHFDVWRWGIGIVVLIAVATVAAWVAHGQDNGPVEARYGAAALAALLVAGSAGLWRVTPGALELREGQWRFKSFDAGSIPEDAVLNVALDFGAFMLLGLRSGSGRRRRGRRWLPVQRRGLESDWHALRCAVHAPQRGIAAS